MQNILIDTNSAELIHIDLGKLCPFIEITCVPINFFYSPGVAFEQGKTLPTPETVPFRLTRDLVDGMGVAGVEGVFRQCCEKTMVLMRTYQEELRTILEVGGTIILYTLARNIGGFKFGGSVRDHHTYNIICK